MIVLFHCLAAGATFLLSFLVMANPRKVNIWGNRWLALFLFILFSMLISEPLYFLKIYNEYPFLFGLESIFIYAMAPALYFGVKYYTLPENSFKKSDLWHFVPFFIFTPFLLQQMFLPSKEKLEQINAPIATIELDLAWPNYILEIQVIYYLCLSIFTIYKYQKNLRIYDADIEKNSLNWLRNSLWAFGIMVIFWLLENRYFTNNTITSLASFIYFTCIAGIGYSFFGQGDVYPFNEKAKKHIQEIIENPQTQRGQRLSEIELVQYKLQLNELMVQQKIFLDENLSLPKLAESMKTSIHNVSYVLNEGYQQNFFQFVNSYRIEEAKKLLVSEKYKHLNMVGIAFECGFNSKTTFNTTFKKITGMSPTSFLEHNVVPSSILNSLKS